MSRMMKRLLKDLPTLPKLEKEYTSLILRANNGHMTNTSKVLGISVRTLQRQVKKWKISK